MRGVGRTSYITEASTASKSFSRLDIEYEKLGWWGGGDLQKMIGCRHRMPLPWVDRLVKVQVRLAKVQLGNVREADKRQIISKGSSRLMGAALQIDGRIK